MNPNQLTQTEIMDILTGLEIYAEECDKRPNHEYTGMRRDWAARAERVRSLSERIAAANGVALAETVRTDR